ncbi:MAG TPA: AMP-binding protein, partial [Burkholderiaceae bacterium]|nr:AMP-binding protein [Burkholderiaceae bacterium]
METPRYTERPLHEYLRQHAREQPDKPAYLWYGRTISYAELDRASDAFAARLAQVGVRKGEPVALFMNNCPQYVMAHYGIQKLGAIVCPCGPLFKEHELQYQLDDLKARVIVAADTLVPIVDKVRAQTAVTHVFATGYAELLPAEASSIDIPAELLALQREPRNLPTGCEDFLTATRSGAAAPEAAIALDDIALMTYTSGTTGLPKGAMLSYRNAIYKSAAAADCNGLRGSDMLLAVAPLYHIAGMVMGVNVTVYTGATCVMLYRFDPVATLQAIARHRVSSWYSIAPMNVACMQVPGARDYDLSSLLMNSVTSFGIAFTEPLARQWREHAPNCQSFESGYGLSETHTVDTYMPKDAIRWGTHGIAIPGNEIRILDTETSSPVPVGQ